MTVAAPAPSSADAAACRRLVESLPDTVAEQPRRPVTPRSGLTAAWGEPAIVLRCGVPVPEEYADAPVCTTVNGIDWFIPPRLLDSSEPVDLTMTAVTRVPRVEVLMPEEHAPHATTLVDVGEAVERHTRPQGPCG